MARSSTRVGTVTLDDRELLEEVQRVIAAAHDGAVSVLQAEIETIAKTAEDKAPVRTGRFKASIESYTSLSPDSVKVGVSIGGGLAPHAYYVRYAADHPDAKLRGKSVWQETMRKPAIAAGNRMAQAIADKIGER